MSSLTPVCLCVSFQVAAEAQAAAEVPCMYKCFPHKWATTDDGLMEATRWENAQQPTGNVQCAVP